MNNKKKCDISLSIKNEQTDVDNVLESCDESKEKDNNDDEIKEESVDYSDTVKSLEENIDTALTTGSLGLAGKFKIILGNIKLLFIFCQLQLNTVLYTTI